MYFMWQNTILKYYIQTPMRIRNKCDLFYFNLEFVLHYIMQKLTY
jgi:hypothetical protein